MQRRKFMQQSILAGGSLFTSLNVMAADNKSTITDNDPFNLNYAIHDGMFKNHAGTDFVEQIKFAHSIGFRAIEDNGMMARPVEQQKLIGNTLAKMGMN